MTEPTVQKGGGFTIGRGLKLIFILQIVIAGFLIVTDLETRWRFDLAGDRPAPTGPIAPGDQTRRYDPRETTPRFADPATTPNINLPDNLPTRLEFTLRDEPDIGMILMMNGAIDPDDPARLTAYLDTLDTVPATVAINSPGGSVDAALQIGAALRAQALNTLILPGMACLSACPYMLAGGVERHVSATGAVGLHQHYYETPGYMPVFFAVENIQRGQGETMRYLIEMGIDPGVMVHGLSTPPDEIYVLVESELIETRLATDMID
ncbi:COG3904 family protein [Yoonia vestfoldensis]|uniref:COG3904 family protein n=1 Tax=Yoonia vestfoldensis TaxID=245188 RepID=UPI0003815520|nr:hypothetical protein [Yoonia vestfoldensis]